MSEYEAYVNKKVNELEKQKADIDKELEELRQNTRTVGNCSCRIETCNAHHLSLKTDEQYSLYIGTNLIASNLTYDGFVDYIQLLGKNLCNLSAKISSERREYDRLNEDNSHYFSRTGNDGVSVML